MVQAIRNSKRIIFKIIGILFIGASLYLVLKSFENHTIDFQGKYTEDVQKVYATIDGIGVEQFFKDTFLSSTSVIIVILFNLIVGILFLFKSQNLKELFFTNISKKSIYFLLSVLVLLIVIIYFFLWDFLIYKNDYTYYALFGILFIFYYSIVLKKSNMKSEFLIYAVVVSYLGLGIFIEFGNYLSPIIHEGSGIGFVDGNSVVYITPVESHKLTMGYIIFRISNYLLIMVSIISFAKSGYKIPFSKTNKINIANEFL